MADTQSRYEYLLQKLQERGCRLTPQRVALVRLLTTSNERLSAAQLYDQLKAQFPTMSLATVYKTLSLLKDMDEVLELGFADDDSRYDGSKPYPHPHLICIRCRKIADPDIETGECPVQQVAHLSGYRIVSHRLDFYGLCPACQGVA